MFTLPRTTIIYVLDTYSKKQIATMNLSWLPEKGEKLYLGEIVKNNEGIETGIKYTEEYIVEDYSYLINTTNSITEINLLVFPTKSDEHEKTSPALKEENTSNDKENNDSKD